MDILFAIAVVIIVVSVSVGSVSYVVIRTMEHSDSGVVAFLLFVVGLSVTIVHAVIIW